MYAIYRMHDGCRRIRYVLREGAANRPLLYPSYRTAYVARIALMMDPREWAIYPYREDD